MQRGFAIWLSGLMLVGPGCGRDQRDRPTARQVSSIAEASCVYLERCYPRVLELFDGGGDYDACVAVAECGRFSSQGLDQERCARELSTGCPYELSSPFQRSADPPFNIDLPGDSACVHRLDRPQVETAEEGQPCFDLAQPRCQAGLVCRYDSPIRAVEGGICGTCVPRVNRGEACEDSSWICADDLSCYEGVCQTFEETFGTCSESNACYPDAECIDGSCRRVPTHARGTRHGTACHPSSGDCGPDLSLRCFDQTCAVLGARGEPCEFGDLLPQCQYGLTCEAPEGFEPTPDLELSDWPHGTCEPARCTGDSSCTGVDCGAGQYCGGGKCLEYSLEGEPQGGRSCEPGTYANYSDDLCEPLRQNGEPCGGGHQCESQNCAPRLDSACEILSYQVRCPGPPSGTLWGTCSPLPEPDDCTALE